MFFHVRERVEEEEAEIEERISRHGFTERMSNNGIDTVEGDSGERV